jgi:hypothetical protein
MPSNIRDADPHELRVPPFPTEVIGPVWPAHPAWLRAFLKLLGSKVEA